MKTSEQGRDFIKSFEKCRLSAYDDGVGVWTYGWGHTKGVRRGDTCTQEEADELFEQDLAQFEDAVNTLITVELNHQYQFDALVSFAYNAGKGALGTSTLLRLINAGNFVSAAGQFERWNKGTVNGQLVVLDGLTKRRKAERKIFESGVYEMHN